METEFAADVFNCEIGKFMFVCGYPKFVYALVCSKLRKHKNLLGGIMLIQLNCTSLKMNIRA